MALTALEKRLLIGGEWVETGTWIDVRSPYSGELVGRVAKGGEEETRRAIDVAAAAMQELKLRQSTPAQAAAASATDSRRPPLPAAD